MANGFESLRKLADVLNVETARISGDPQRLQLAMGEVQARKAQEMDALLNQQIDKMNLPDVQKTFLKAMTAKDKYGALYPTAGKKPTSYQEYALTDSTPTEQEYLQFLERKARAGATQISTGDKEWSKLGAKKYEERYDAATSAANSNVNLDNLENILNQGLETGFGSEVGLTLNRIGQLMLGSEYKAGDIASAESFAAGATQLILPEVKKLGVNPTDKDLDFVVKGSPELTKSVEGNKLMLKALKLSNARAIDQHNFDNDFYTENPNATEIQRNAAFANHKIQNPQIYTAQSLKEEYNNLLEREAAKKLQSGQITTTSTEELPLELQ